MHYNKITKEIYQLPKEITVNGIRYPKQVFDNTEMLNSLNVFKLTEEPIPDGRLYTFVEEVDSISLVLKRTPTPKSEAELLAVAKEDKLAQIEADFNLAESQSVSYLGFEFVGGQDSVKSIDAYYRLVLLAGQTSFTIWDTNKEDHVLTEAEVKGLIIAIGSVSSANQFNLKNRKAALANATTLAEVEAV